jgi:plasmid stability protein
MARPVVSSFPRRDLVPTQSVTLRLPDALYQHLKRRAEQAQRAIEDELLDVVAAAVLVDDELPLELSEALSSLALLDDEALWRAARTRLPAEAAEELEGLHLKRQREGISALEAEQTAALLRQYERAMLVRAQAAALLKQRGHDVSVLLTSP